MPGRVFGKSVFSPSRASCVSCTSSSCGSSPLLTSDVTVPCSDPAIPATTGTPTVAFRASSHHQGQPRVRNLVQ